MAITNQMIDQAYSDLKATCGGVRNDYFALIYLEREFRVERADAVLCQNSAVNRKKEDRVPLDR